MRHNKKGIAMTIRRMAAIAAAFMTLAASQGVRAEDAPKEIKIATEGAYAPWNFVNAEGKLDGSKSTSPMTSAPAPS